MSIYHGIHVLNDKAIMLMLTKTWSHVDRLNSKSSKTHFLVYRRIVESIFLSLKRDRFKYLESMIQGNGQIDEDVTVYDSGQWTMDRLTRMSRTVLMQCG